MDAGFESQESKGLISLQTKWENRDLKSVSSYLYRAAKASLPACVPLDILCAVSGGADSVALLCFLKSHQRMLGIRRLAVCHVHHGIRGVEADRDEAFVKALSQKWALSFYSYRGNAPLLARKQGKGLEEAARALRYAAFADAMHFGAYPVLALAHHGMDQAETVLLHLLRGSGLSGLGGMQVLEERKFVQNRALFSSYVYPEERVLQPSETTFLWRPFLSCAPESLKRYLALLGQGFLVDQTNFDEQNPRNALRHQVLPLMEQLYPGTQQALYRFSQTVGEEDAYLACLARQKMEELLLPSGALGRESLPPPLLYRVLREYCFSSGFQTDLSQAHLAALASLYQKNRGSYALPSGFYARMQEDALFLLRDIEPTKPFNGNKGKLKENDQEEEKLFKAPSMKECFMDKIDQGALVGKEGCFEKSKTKVREFEQNKKTEMENKEIPLSVPGMVQLPLGQVRAVFGERKIEKLPPTRVYVPLTFKDVLRFRPWKKGDRMQPFGMKGTKLVSDILTDRHAKKKEKIFLLCAEEKILWIPGFQAAEGLRIQEKSENSIELCFLPEGET